jgi:hypothetical protein
VVPRAAVMRATAACTCAMYAPHLRAGAGRFTHWRRRRAGASVARLRCREGAVSGAAHNCDAGAATHQSFCLGLTLRGGGAGGLGGLGDLRPAHQGGLAASGGLGVVAVEEPGGRGPGERTAVAASLGGEAADLLPCFTGGEPRLGALELLLLVPGLLEALAGGVALALLPGGACEDACAAADAGGRADLEERAGGGASDLERAEPGGGGGALGGKVSSSDTETLAAVYSILTTPFDFITLPGGVRSRVALGAAVICTVPGARLLLPAMELQLTVGVTTSFWVSSWLHACASTTPSCGRLSEEQEPWYEKAIWMV